ncbi:hypothetical protein CITRIK5_50384 [Citricoccus sp. K5]|nr:hypothetical protein CITRIK5_50384 [Citricoccus sp. K5]
MRPGAAVKTGRPGDCGTGAMAPVASTQTWDSMDLPGYGTTPTPPRALTVPECGQVLTQVIRARRQRPGGGD